MLPSSRAALDTIVYSWRRNFTASLAGTRRYAGRIWCRNFSTPNPGLTPYDRFILKITRTVKGEIPYEASMDTLDKANSRFRIGIMVVMMVFCAAGSAVAIAHGKREADARINTVYQQNKDRYARLKDKDKR